MAQSITEFGFRQPIVVEDKGIVIIGHTRLKAAKQPPIDGAFNRKACQTGENVLDLFGGSGSTLIAAQQTGRQAFLMELDPLYCNVDCSALGTVNWWNG